MTDIAKGIKIGLERYPEFKPLVDEIVKKTIHLIAQKAESIESEMRYKNLFLLEMVIIELEKRV